jgi:hypothetical protein
VGLFGRINMDDLSVIVQDPTGNAPELPSPYDRGLGGGAVVTYRLPIGSKLALTPAVGYGAGQGPAWRFSNCGIVSVDGSEMVSCNDPDNVGQTQAIMSSFVTGPLARLEAGFESRSETSIKRFQVGVQASYGLTGSVTSSSGSYAEGGNVQIEVADTFTVHPLRLEALAGFNMTF